MTITAEGVETEQQRLLLRTIGCDQLQGYYLGRPCAPEAIGDLLARLPEPPSEAVLGFGLNRP
jgi:EAL domain-containing protein (putative c-di-GMP-specific phosphodiesterase class I)